MTDATMVKPPHPRPFFGWYYYPARDMNGIVLLVILLCAASHLVQSIKARRALRAFRERRYSRITTLLDDGQESEDMPEAKRSGHGAVYRLSVELGNWLYLAIFPSWMYAPESISDALFTGVYCSVMLFYCVHRTPAIPGDPYPFRHLANMCGVMAYAQTPVVFLLAVKNNPLQPLLGITYQKLNYLHRASARACILASWVHTVLWIPPLWHNGSMLAFYVIMGYLALAGYTGLWLLSVRFIRRRAYELFLLSHIILSVAFIVGGCLHWPIKSYWLWPSILVWFIDRSIRILKRVHANWCCCPSDLLSDDSTVELVSADVMRVRIKRKGLRWSAGQHFFITAPSLPGMPHESHPFSIANVPPYSRPSSGSEPYEAIFLIRAHGGFTSHLLAALRSSSSSSIPLALEGPYGHDHPLEHYSTVVLVAGGTGVTFCLSYFMRLLQPFAVRLGKGEGYSQEATGTPGGTNRGADRDALLGDDRDADGGHAAGPVPSSPTCLSRLKMIWHVRKAEDVEWIAPMLNTALDALHTADGRTGRRADIDVSVDVYVTRAVPSTFHPPPMQQTETSHGRIPIDSPHRHSPHSQAPIGSSCGITLPQPGASVYEGSSAEGLPDPFRSGRYPMRCMSSPIREDQYAEGRATDYALDPDDGEDATPLLPNTKGESSGLMLSSSATSGYGSTGSSDRGLSRFRGSSSTLCSVRDHPKQPCPPERSSVYGLSEASRAYVNFYPGRADLQAIIPRIADADKGEMAVATCGPVPLMHDTRRAVWAANCKDRIRAGKRAVSLLEETVGH